MFTHKLRTLALTLLTSTTGLSGCDLVEIGAKVPKCDDPRALELAASVIRPNIRYSFWLDQPLKGLSFTKADMILTRGVDRDIGKSQCAATFVYSSDSRHPEKDACKGYLSRAEYDLQYDSSGQLVSSSDTSKIGMLACVKFTSDEIDLATKNSAPDTVALAPRATTNATVQSRTASEIDGQSLLNQYSDANSSCRGGVGDAPKTIRACAERDRLFKQLRAAGMCYGKVTDEAAYQADWHTCGPDSLSD